MKFDAEIEAVRTRASDQTYHVTLELPEYAVEQAQQLLAMTHDAVIVTVELIDTNPVKERNNALKNGQREER